MKVVLKSRADGAGVAIFAQCIDIFLAALRNGDSITALQKNIATLNLVNIGTIHKETFVWPYKTILV